MLRRLRGIVFQMRGSAGEMLRHCGAVRDKEYRRLSRRVAELKFHMNTLSGLRDGRLCRCSPPGDACSVMNFYVTLAELNEKKKPREDKESTQRLEWRFFFLDFSDYFEGLIQPCMIYTIFLSLFLC